MHNQQDLPIAPSAAQADLRHDKMKTDGMVSSGRRNLLKDAGNRETIDGAVRGIRSRYSESIKAAGLPAKVKLWFRMRQEIRAAIDSIAPRRGCYIKQ
jgi:hypothetical protein